MSKEKIRFSMGRICGYFGYSRQGYYKHRQLEQARRTEADLIVTAVREIRKTQPRVGSRKLKNMLYPEGIDISRDRLFDILRNNKMLIEKQRAYHKTTNSLHGLRYHPNLIKDLEILRPAQVYVSDITYIHTLEGFMYLSLVTDHYSRKIVGYDLSESLSVEGSLRALKMSLKHVKNTQTLIHHSDRGIQYCSKAYTDMLRDHGVSISMTEDDHVYENALAERVNGILKDEFYLGQTLRSKTIAHKLVRDSIKIYNQKRLHMALNYHTPDSVFYAA